jgi:hypothetical protein
VSSHTNALLALSGLQVKIEAAQRCCSQSGIAAIEPSTGAGFADLICIGCGTRRGQISQSTAEFLAAIVAKFGSPSEPIIFRRDLHPLPVPREQPPGKAGTQT